MARALSFRQIRLLSFSSQKSRTTSREYSQIISTSRWVKKVELYTSMLTCISQNGNNLLILETEDSTIEPAFSYLALLVLRVNSKCLWERIVRSRITVSCIGGKKTKNGVKIGPRRSKQAELGFFFFAKADFSPFPHNEEPGPRLVYSQTEKTMNTEIFLECYCVARKKITIRREKTKRQTRTFTCPDLCCNWSKNSKHSWNISSVDNFPGPSVKVIIEKAYVTCIKWICDRRSLFPRGNLSVLLLIASLTRPSKSLQTLTDYIALDQKCVSSHSWVGILVISNV